MRDPIRPAQWPADFRRRLEDGLARYSLIEAQDLAAGVSGEAPHLVEQRRFLTEQALAHGLLLDLPPGWLTEYADA